MLEMTSQEIEEMLTDTVIGRLAMADLDGKPYTIPLPYCWANAAIYLRLPLVGRKGQILSRNNQVCFEVDQFDSSLSEYASVLIEGRLVEVTNLREKAFVKRLNDAKYLRLRNGYRPGHGRSTPLEHLPLRRIDITRISGRRRDGVRTSNRLSALVGAAD